MQSKKIELRIHYLEQAEPEGRETAVKDDVENGDEEPRLPGPGHDGSGVRIVEEAPGPIPSATLHRFHGSRAQRLRRSGFRFAIRRHDRSIQLKREKI